MHNPTRMQKLNITEMSERKGAIFKKLSRKACRFKFCLFHIKIEYDSKGISDKEKGFFFGTPDLTRISSSFGSSVRFTAVIYIF